MYCHLINGKRGSLAWIFIGKLELWKKSIRVTLYADHQGAISHSYNPELYISWTKIDVRFHLIREPDFIKQLNIVYIPTAKIAANGPTKRLLVFIFL